MTAAVGIYITIPQMSVSRFLAGEFTCAGDLVFLFFLFFLSFCGYSVSYTVYYSRDFPFTFLFSGNVSTLSTIDQCE
jgi:hypothetical protein